MNAKEQLKRDFGKNPDKYYKVKLFTENGFERRKCPKCGSYFWTMDSSRKHCPNPPCEEYSFIGKSPIRSMDYIETWRTIEKFFVKNGHESIPSYPVVCRWFPGLFFTVASIVAFQRSVAGKTVFEMPAEKIIIPQVCLRFSDIENVGVTGRHMTNFTMIGQHSIYEKVNGKQKGYWKDECIDLDYRMLTEALGVKPKDISFMEDVWTGPNAFGYSLEYFTGGLELGNAVFTEFVGTPDNYKPMGYRVIDMGAGLERFTWLSQGTPTAYDAVYGPVMKDIKRRGDFDENLFNRYAAIAGGLNIDEIGDIGKLRQNIAKQLKVDVSELNNNVEPLQALYAIADHTKTLLYAINDGGLLSNVGGGYNLRIIFRRALSFIEKYNLDIELFDVCKMHARYLKPLNPELLKSLPEIEKILDVEKKRYETTLMKSAGVVKDLLSKSPKIGTERLVQMYESQGITPELIENVADKEGLKAEIPKDFYHNLSERHMKESTVKEKKKSIDTSNVTNTELMFYDHEKDSIFKAKLLKKVKAPEGQWMILDRTLFYPEGGGQDYDLGKINGNEVVEVQKFGNVVAHRVKGDAVLGSTVTGEVDMKRRLQHAQHHTAVHLVNGAARKLLGEHVWQAGAGKSLEKAHLDITHYEALTLDEITEIEKLANDIIMKKVPISRKFMARPEAEKLYGMRIYQGGATPDRMIRIVNTPDWDTEACAGTHLSNTGDAVRIAITSSERIQDGVVRLTMVAGDAARRYLKNVKAEASGIMKTLEKTGFIKFSKLSEDEFIRLSDMRKSASEFSVGIDMLAKTAEKFTKDLSSVKIKPMTFNDISSALSYVFENWKSARKIIEDSLVRSAGNVSQSLLKDASDGLLVTVVEGDRKYMIKAASAMLEKNSKLTIVLANEENDIVIMSKVRDAGQVLEKVCAKCGGKGGGRGQMAQGKIDDIKAFRKVRESL
ncbi:MAG: alanine--tRNA ligase [Candidatus Aenigmarchaeota archaeon]|nr:alanine--tRNA ligase [Candidatus Aenigmarchaeota archaeon]